MSRNFVVMLLFCYSVAPSYYSRREPFSALFAHFYHFCQTSSAQNTRTGRLKQRRLIPEEEFLCTHYSSVLWSLRLWLSSALVSRSFATAGHGRALRALRRHPAMYCGSTGSRSQYFRARQNVFVKPASSHIKMANRGSYTDSISPTRGRGDLPPKSFTNDLKGSSHRNGTCFINLIGRRNLTQKENAYEQGHGTRQMGRTERQR